MTNKKKVSNIAPQENVSLSITKRVSLVQRQLHETEDDITIKKLRKLLRDNGILLIGRQESTVLMDFEFKSWGTIMRTYSLLLVGDDNLKESV